MTSVRRNDFDVTNTVQVSSAAAVEAAVQALYLETWPQIDLEPLHRSFDYFEKLFAGQVPGYYGVDTVYHDRQHTLDITLALARLIVGYERQHQPPLCLGAERATVGLIVGLFHDVGYLRRADDSVEFRHGAELTRVHVSRGARFLDEYLPTIGLARWAPVAREIVHFTGYEVPFSKIGVSDPLDIKLGHLVGTADMIGQMADRCYLEILFDGRNPYMEAIDRNLEYLRQILRSENWRLLRRNPPVFSALADPMATVRGLMVRYLHRAWTGKR